MLVEWRKASARSTKYRPFVRVTCYLLAGFLVHQVKGTPVSTTRVVNNGTTERNDIKIEASSPQARTSVPLNPIHNKYNLLRKVMIANRTVTCNDGSRSGYYLRKYYDSKKWIVFLEGGWHCFDKKSCESRWLRMRNLMSSKQWPEAKLVGGILSQDSKENPYWWNANHVFVPYCSSDSWSGTAPANVKGDFAFVGSLIIQEVVKDLLNRGLREADSLLLAGSSAGGTGVLLNLDRVADALKASGLKRVKVRGLADSGWFLDNEPYQPMPCRDPYSCAPAEAIKLGMKLWKGQVPVRCQAQYPTAEHWRCYFGYRLYPTLQAPVFVFQWLFDEAQMTANNVGAPLTKQQWDYIHKMGDDLRTTLKNVSAVFAPSCISHVVLTKKDWLKVKINHISLPQAIQCWEQRRHPHRHSHRHTDYSRTRNDSSVKIEMLADMPLRLLGVGKSIGNATVTEWTTREEDKARRRLARKKGERGRDQQTRRGEQRRTKKKGRKNRERKRRRRKQGEKRRDKGPHGRRESRDISSLFPEESGGGDAKVVDEETTTSWPEEGRGSKEKGPRKGKRRSNQVANNKHHRDPCNEWLIDECSWPQCNRACPRLQNPFTGEEMDFIELLKSFGLEMSSVASALGMDLATLNEMDNDTLLQLLTQQTN